MRVKCNSMKINLEYPFNEIWSRGYLVTNRENRRHVILYNSHHNRSSISYARYLLSVKEKRFLSEDEAADHIDNDKTNDAIENLQVLTKKENSRKHTRTISRKLVLIKCPVCEKEFTRRYNQTHLLGNNKTLSFCRRECLYSFQRMQVDKELWKDIAEKSIIKIYDGYKQ